MVCCPHGGIVTLPIIFSMIGVALTFYSTFSCHFFISDGLFVDNVDNLSSSIDRGYGPWTIQGTYPVDLGSGRVFDSAIANIINNVTVSNLTLSDAATGLSAEASNLLSQEDSQFAKQQFCYPWSQYGYDSFTGLLDTDMHIARGVSMAAAVLSVLLMFTLLFMGCCQFRKCSFFFIGFLSMVTGLLTAASFVAMKSMYCQDASTCTIGYGGKVAIAAAVWWVFIGLFLWCMDKTPTEERRRIQQQQQTVAPDEPKPAHHATVAVTTAGRDVEQGQGPQTRTVVY